MYKAFRVSIFPLVPQRWLDFEQLFGPRGACGCCWCMYWKLRGNAFLDKKGDTARQMQQSVVAAGTVPGLLAYLADDPVGWIAVEPRSAYLRLAHSRILKPVDQDEVWSVPCFFVSKTARRQGLMVELLISAIEYVRQRGGRILEGYPIDQQANMLAVFAYTGLASAFRKAGFHEVVRRSEKRPIFRFCIE
jgi:GNAT superfamily N-acetyltransferase